MRIRIALAAVTLAIVAAGPSQASVKGDSTVDQHTRAYAARVQTCRIAVGLFALDIRGGMTDPVKLADAATQARDICDSAKDELLTLSTDHFDKQANTAWIGVERYKSGMNAFLAYLDSQSPTKLIEVRDKLAAGGSAVRIGLRGINLRRKVYGLKPLKA